MTSPGQYPSPGGQWAPQPPPRQQPSPPSQGWQPQAQRSPGRPPPQRQQQAPAQPGWAPQPQPQQWGAPPHHAPQPQPQPQQWGPPPHHAPQPQPQPQQWGPPPHQAPPAWHQAQQPWPGPSPAAEDPRPSPAVLLGTALWRVGIGSLALYYAQTGKEETMSSESLSYLSNVGTGAGFLALAAYPLLVGGRRHEPRTGWLRGALTIMMLLVGLVFIVGMGGDPDGPHAVIPALVTVDWLFVGRNQFRTRAWEPITWIVLPLAYLFYHQANEVPLYEDILGDEAFGTYVPALLAGSIVLGYVLWGAVLVRRAATRAQA
jgi:hypothetical protein